MFSEGYFSRVIGDFLNHYGKNLANNSLAFGAWYKYLSSNLEEKELIPALENAIIKCEFCPSPSRIVELFKGGDEVLALEEWGQCVKAASSTELELRLSPQGEKALASLGGLKRIKEADAEKTYGILCRDFTARWTQYRTAIASGKITPPPLPLNSAQEPPLNSQDDVWVTPEELTAFWSKINGSIKTIK